MWIIAEVLEWVSVSEKNIILLPDPLFFSPGYRVNLFWIGNELKTLQSALRQSKYKNALKKVAIPGRGWLYSTKK